MGALRMATMGQGTSITASSWAWAHGRAGDTATAGAVVSSLVAVVEGMLAAVDTTAAVDTPDVDMQGIEDVARMQAGVTDIVVAAMPKRVVVRLVAERAAAADRMMAVADIAAGSC